MLITKPNIANPDDVYQHLVDVHNGRTDEQSELINAKLLLLLVNHIGDEDVIRQAVAIASREVEVQHD